MRIGLIGSAIVLLAAIASAAYERLKVDSVITDNKPGAAQTAPAQPSYSPSIITPAEEAPAPPPAPPAELAATVMQAGFKTLDGKTKRLSDYSGKVLVVDLWATWCGPCRLEIPHLVELAKDYKSKGVEIVGLTSEDPETQGEQVKNFSNQFKINYSVGFADQQMVAGLANGRNGIPQTIIIGRDGKVRRHFIGFSPVPADGPQPRLSPYTATPAVMKAALDEAISAN